MDNTTMAANGSTSLHGIKFDLISHILFAITLMMTIIGIFGNTVALFILTSSKKIKTSKSYILLMNQSAIDLLYCLIVILNIALINLLSWNNMNGLWDSVLCHVIYSNLNSGIVLCCSSYNLVALSLDRMVSVLWPIMHRINITRRNMLNLSVFVWILGCIVMMMFSIPVNGIKPNKTCYFWDNYQLNSTSYTVYMISFNMAISIIPLLLMLVSFIIIYIRISTTVSNTNVKLNVIKMLATCVCLYCACHIPRAIISIYHRFYENELIVDIQLFITSMMMVQLNAIVNPIIYCIQYVDYRKELRKRVDTLLGRTINSLEYDSKTIDKYK